MDKCSQQSREQGGRSAGRLRAATHITLGHTTLAAFGEPKVNQGYHHSCARSRPRSFLPRTTTALCEALRVA
jgi:hypothetical protein